MTKLTSFCFRQAALSTLFIAGVVAAAAQAPLALASLPSAPSSLALPAAVPLTGVDGAFPETSTSSLVPSAVALTASNAIADPLNSAATPSLSAAEPDADVSSSLPDAPSAAELRAATADGIDLAPQNQATPTVAPRLTKYIPSGWTAQTITGREKFLLGVRDLYSPLNFIAMFASAGYEHVLNSEPNYGTDKGAFGERLGAAAIRESSQGFLTDSVFSPIFHEDPRYYIQGSGHSFFYRTAYVITRPFITRSDNGNNTINGALLVAYAGSAGLSYAYYPQSNRNFHDTASTFGDSLGGAALGYFVSEFSDDVLKAVHLRKQ